MILPRDARDLAIDLLDRSVCAVQVAAVMADRNGISAWGWNSSGPDGLGLHAEHHCISRSNPARRSISTIYVAARRRKSGNPVTARPCEDCMKRLRGVQTIVWRDKEGVWRID